MLFVSSFRKRAIPKVEQLREKITSSRNKRAKHLLAALDALHANELDGFENNLTLAIRDFINRNKESPLNHIPSYFALPESLLWNEALSVHPELQLEKAITDQLLCGQMR
ncbi:MAG: hypothetical protein AAF483_10110 [Planctomycetota bacterium]